MVGGHEWGVMGYGMFRKVSLDFFLILIEVFHQITFLVLTERQLEVVSLYRILVCHFGCAEIQKKIRKL